MCVVCVCKRAERASLGSDRYMDRSVTSAEKVWVFVTTRDGVYPYRYSSDVRPSTVPASRSTGSRHAGWRLRGVGDGRGPACSVACTRGAVGRRSVSRPSEHEQDHAPTTTVDASGGRSVRSRRARRDLCDLWRVAWCITVACASRRIMLTKYGKSSSLLVSPQSGAASASV